MKTLLLIVFVVSFFPLLSQDVHEYMKAGVKKHEQKDYRGAIEDYTKVLELDPANADAYLNRGNCAMELRDFEPALKDLDKVIALSPTLARAYYSRAFIYAAKKNYKEALVNADKVIELDPKTPNCLTLRGQLHIVSGEDQKGCDDFITAKNAGDTNAFRYIQKFCGFMKGYAESLKINWPDEEKWKLGSNQETAEMQVMDIIREGETLQNWTELGNMTAHRGLQGIPMDTMMKILTEGAKTNAPDTKVTFIEKNEQTEYPWIIFKMESPRFNNDDKPESQLWYVIQGKQALYTNFRAVKKDKITDEQREKWVKFFKVSEIVYR